MMQMEYITLKTPDGQLVGHARVKEGAVSLQLREPVEGQGAVFTPKGVLLLTPGSIREVQEPILAAAMLRQGQLFAWGLARGQKLTRAQLEKQLNQAGMTARPREETWQQESRPEASPNPPEPERPTRQEGQTQQEARSQQADQKPALRPLGLRIRRPRPPKGSGLAAGDYQLKLTADPEDPTNRAVIRAENRAWAEGEESLRRAEFAYMAGVEEREPAQRRSDVQTGQEAPLQTEPFREEELRYQSGLNGEGDWQPGKTSAQTAAQTSQAQPPKDGAAYAQQVTDSREDFTNQAIRRAERWSGEEIARDPRWEGEAFRDEVIAAHSTGQAADTAPAPGPTRSYELRFQAGVQPEKTEFRWQEVTRPPMEPPALQQPDPEEVRSSRFPLGPREVLNQQAAETAAPLNTAIVPPIAPLPPRPEDASRDATQSRKEETTPARTTDPDTEAFFALLRRSEEVYRSITEPVQSRTPREDAPKADRPSAEPLPFLRQERSTWQGEVSRILNGEPDRRPVENPFPHIFPNASFSEVRSGGITDRLEGSWRQGNEEIRIHAVPGAYSPLPPTHLADHTRFIRSKAGGFWVKLEPVEKQGLEEGN